jgi:hypothetical protein
MRQQQPSWLPRCLLGGLTASLALTLIGCGAKTGTVTGKVTYKTDALKGGTVIFSNPDMTTVARAEIQPDGSYTATGVPTGEILVGVDNTTLKPPKKGVGRKYEPPKGATVPDEYLPKGGATDPSRYVPIPDKYKDPKQSGIKLTVSGGSQAYDVKLE